jgi:hypothetical protein
LTPKRRFRSARALRGTLCDRLCSWGSSPAACSYRSRPWPSPAKAAGRWLATELCGDCHQVRQPFPSLFRYPPTFEEIANLPSTTRLSLKVFLQTNHRAMPNFIISKSDTDNIIEYIVSLKRR